MVTVDVRRPGAPVFVRYTHKDGFRSGQWARIDDVVWHHGRPCFYVVFVDGTVDEWAIKEDLEHYEFVEKLPGARKYE